MDISENPIALMLIMVFGAPLVVCLVAVIIDLLFGKGNK
jgi:hypothetical protein